MKAMSKACVRVSTMLLGGALGVGAMQCTVAECSRPDYRDPECRVILENELARLETPRGTELRFQEPGAVDATRWEPRGVFEWTDNAGVVRARVAGLGDFAISIEGTVDGLSLVLENVDPRTQVHVEGARGAREVPAEPIGLERRVDLEADDGASVWIRGTFPCPSRYRLAVTGDIQTHPDEFRRILDRLVEEAAAADAAGEPLLGLVLVGDLSEWSRDDEFENMQTLMRGSAVPVVTVPGNHDVFDRRRSSYNRRFGPGNHAFSVCDARVVLFDSGSGSLAPSIEGRLPELLARQGARHLLVGLHHPPFPGVTGAGWTSEAQAQWFLAEAAFAGVDLIVAGHKHELRSFDAISVGDVQLREIIVGTAGADQGIGAPRYGYVRLTLAPEGTMASCFIEVPAAVTPAPQGGVQGLPLCRAEP